MHSHRRANSYSQGAGVAPFWKLGSNAISSENVNTQSAIARATPERRSTGRRSTYSKGYGAVTICKPAVVKFAVNEDPWVVVANDMSLRPRSPSKSRTGSSSDMHQLDQTLSFIRDQLLGLKSERTQISERLDSLVTDISRTEEELVKKQLVAVYRKSPGTPLRRIQSLEHQSGSRITLSTDTTSACSIDLFDDDVMKIIDNSDSGSSSSIESSPVFPARGIRAGSSQSLPRSYSPRLERKEESTDSSVPKVLVAPRRSYSVGRRGSGSNSSFQRTPSPFSQLEEIKEGESSKMLPLRFDKLTTARDSISGSLLSLPQCVLSPEHKTCADVSGAWDSHSVIMRVSSATGQLEEVPSHSQTLPKKMFTTKIMNLSEEPQAVLGRKRDSSISLVSNGSIKRRSIVLDSIVTDV